MNDQPKRASAAGRAYLDIQSLARRTGQATQQLLQLYALEGFLARLAASGHDDRLVLKGGVLLAAYRQRRPTRDIDLAGRGVSNDLDEILKLAQAIAAIPMEDGLIFEIGNAIAEVIREDDQYSGVRVRTTAMIARARIHVGIDVNVGDPIWPGPSRIAVPKLLGGSINLLGYPLTMVFAEKIVTMVQRATANTRWRDFADVYALAGKQTVDAVELSTAIAKVAGHRKVTMVGLEQLLDGYPGIAHLKWQAWRRKQGMEDLPTEFAEVVGSVISFADPVLTGQAHGSTWQPTARTWLN